MIKDNLQRCDISLIKCLEDIAQERVKIGKDKKTESFRRLTKAVANLISTDKEIKDRLINAYLEDDRGKGNGYEK